MRLKELFAQVNLIVSLAAVLILTHRAVFG
jgi:hypothetical protein